MLRRFQSEAYSFSPGILCVCVCAPSLISFKATSNKTQSSVVLQYNNKADVAACVHASEYKVFHPHKSHINCRIYWYSNYPLP